jgi:hypothetical protein
MDFNTLYSEFDDDELDNETVLNNNFSQLLTILKQDLQKSKYKKVYQDISSIEDGIYSNLKLYWKLREYKLEAVLKIISKRLFDYTPGSKKGYPLVILVDWFKIAGDTLEEWGGCINNLPNNKDEINSYIYLTLCELYLHSLHLKNQNRYFEATALLAIAERLIKEHSIGCQIPRTLNICQCILLFISSLLIADNCFKIAKQYQYRTMQLLVKELFYLTNKDDRFLTEANNLEHSFKKLFTNFSITCYQLGVCEENIGHLDRAAVYYRQSNWSAKKFLKFKAPEFVQFIHFLEDKANKYIQLERTLIDENKRRQKYTEKDKKDIRKVGKELSEEKFNKIKVEVEKVIALLYDDPIESETPKNYIMSTIGLIEKLLSPEFRHIVKDSHDIKIFKMDKEFKEKFKKRMSQIRIAKLFNERAKELFSNRNFPSLKEIFSLVKICNEKNENEPIFLNTEITGTDKKQSSTKKDYKGRASSVLTGETEYTQPRYAMTDESHKFIKQIKKQQTSKSQSMRTSMTKKPISGTKDKRIAPDPFVFNNQFKKKIDYLNALEKKEVAFQKKLLSLKRCEKIPYDIKDELDIETQVKTFFQNTVRTKTNTHLQEEEVDAPIVNKRAHRYRKLERSIIQSLDPKKLEEFIKFLRKRDSQAILSEEFLPKLTNADKIPKGIDKIKNHIINDLNKKLEVIEMKRNSCLKVINPSKYTKPSFTARRSVTQCDKPVKIMDEFIKQQALFTRRISLFGSIKK